MRKIIIFLIGFMLISASTQIMYLFGGDAEENQQKIENFYGDNKKKSEAEKAKEKQIKDLQNQIISLKEKEAALIDKYDSKEITQDEYNKQKTDLDKQIKKLEDKLFYIGGEKALLEVSGEGGKGDSQPEKSGSEEGGVIMFNDDEMIDLIGEGSDEDKANFFNKMQQEKKKAAVKLSAANIDGFEEKIDRISDLGYWIGSGLDSQLKYSISDKESYGGKHSLYIQYNIGSDVYNNWISISKAFKHVLDLSEAKTISMAVKSKGTGGTLSIVITSADGGSWTYQDTYALYHRDWVRVEVPLEHTKNLDKSQITGMSITITFGSKVSSQRVATETAEGYTEIGWVSYHPVVDVAPINGYLYIDEISYTMGSSKMSSGNSFLKVNGKLFSEYDRIEGMVPYMINYGEINLKYISDRYSVSGIVDIPIYTITKWNDTDFDRPVWMQSVYNYYSTKKWGWSFDRAVYIRGIDVQIKYLNPYIDHIYLGSLGMNYGRLAFSMLYMHSGVGVDGKIAQTSYNLDYLKLEGDGYGIIGRFRHKFNLIDTEINSAVLWEDRRAAVAGSGSSSYATKSYKQSYVAFLELTRSVKYDTSIFFKKQGGEKLGLITQAGIYTSDEDWFGHTYYDSDRELVYAPGAYVYEDGKVNNKKTRDEIKYHGNAYRGMIEAHMLMPYDLKVGQKIEYRYIEPNYMGEGYNGSLQGLTYEYAPYLFKRDIDYRQLYCETDYDAGREMAEEYWQDLNGVFFDTTIGWKWIDTRFYYDISKKISNSDFHKKVMRIFTDFSVWRVVLEHVYRRIKWENKLFSAENKIYRSNEFTLKFLIADYSQIIASFGLQKYWSDEASNIFNDDKVYYIAWQNQWFDNVSFSILYKKVDAQKAADSASTAGSEGGETFTDFTTKLESVSYLVAAVSIVF